MRFKEFLKEKHGHIYNVDVNIRRVLDFTDIEHRKEYAAAQEKWNDRYFDKDEWLPKLSSPGFLSSKSGHPSFGYARGIHQALPEYGAIWVDEGGDPPSLAVFDVSALKIVDHNTGWYHGSPHNITKFTKGPIFLTKYKDVAERYARGSVFGAGRKK